MAAKQVSSLNKNLILFCIALQVIVIKAVDLNCTLFKDKTVPFIQHPTDCTKYISCPYEVIQIFDCPNGLYFNPKIMVCDWPNNVDCTDKNNDKNSSSTETLCETNPAPCPPPPCSTKPPPCEVITTTTTEPPCEIIPTTTTTQSPCVTNPPPCSTEPPPCEVITTTTTTETPCEITPTTTTTQSPCISNPPPCSAEPPPCEVTTTTESPCQTDPPPCEITPSTPTTESPCVTKPPPCITEPPPCEVTTTTESPCQTDPPPCEITPSTTTTESPCVTKPPPCITEPPPCEVTEETTTTTESSCGTDPCGNPLPCNPCLGKYDGYEILGGYSLCPNKEMQSELIHLEVPGACSSFIHCDNYQRAFCKFCAPGDLVFDVKVNRYACVWSYLSSRTDCVKI